MGVIIKDTFTGVDHAAIAGRTPDTVNNGNNWLDPSSKGKILSNKAARAADYALTYDTLVNTALKTYTIEAKVKCNPATYAMISFRGNTAGNNNWAIWMNPPGSTTARLDYNGFFFSGAATLPATLVSGQVYTIKVEVSETDFLIYWDGTLIITASVDHPGWEAVHKDNTHVGFAFQGTGCTVDDYTVSVLSTPVWETNYPALGDVDKTTADFDVKTDIASTAYFVCLPRGSTAPTSAQVKAGTDAGDNALATGFYGSVSITALTEGTLTASNLLTSTFYDAYIVAEADLIQASPELLEFKTDIASSDYIKRTFLEVSTSFNFQLNLGDPLGLDTAQDVTDYVVNASDINEKLTKSSLNVGGVILPSMKLVLKNNFGHWNKLGKLFKSGYINNSVFTIVTKYIGPDGTELSPGVTYKGLLKSTSCSWDRNEFLFECSLSPATNLFTTEKVQAGLLSNDTFENIIYKLLNRAPFTDYMTISKSNWSFGWDVNITNQISQLVGNTVKNALDRMMLLSGSIYYVNFDQELVIIPVLPASPVSALTLRGDDIFRIVKEDFYWKGHYTSVVWDDSDNEVKVVEMNYSDRVLYQYDYIPLTITDKLVTNSSNRDTILDNILGIYKYLKRRVRIECKWYPELNINDCVTLDVPEESIKSDEMFIWNETQWNDDKKWGIKQPGISFSNAELWKVIGIKRDALGEMMQLELLQLYSDDEL